MNAEPIRPEPPCDGEREHNADVAACLGGHPRAIRFPPYWHAWFSRQTAQRLDVLDELVDERVERQVLRDVLRRLKHAAIVAFLASAAAAHWFSDQLAWIAERLPVLKLVWAHITGGR